MKKIKVGIVATGMMAQKHADALHRLPEVEIVGIADPCVQNLDEVAQKLGIVHVYSDFTQMCEKENIEVLHNCTPNSEHYKVNKYAIEHGIGVYSEKPLGISLEESLELLTLLDRHPVPNGVNFNYRSNAIVREMHARIRNGKAGKPLLVHGCYLQDWLMYDTDYNWRIDSDKGGKSRTVADVGSHWFDTAQVVLEQKICDVYAKLITVYPERKKPLIETGTFTTSDKNAVYETVKVNSEDAGMILVKFEDGTYGNIILSQVSGGYKNNLEFNVDCANYSMRWNQEEPDHLEIGSREFGVSRIYSSSGAMTDDANFYATLPGGHPVGWADALYNNIRLFYKSIEEGSYTNKKQEYATFEDATYVMRLVDACLESNRKNCWVHIN